MNKTHVQSRLRSWLDKNLRNLDEKRFFSTHLDDLLGGRADDFLKANHSTGNVLGDGTAITIVKTEPYEESN